MGQAVGSSADPCSDEEGDMARWEGVASTHRHRCFPADRWEASVGAMTAVWVQGTRPSSSDDWRWVVRNRLARRHDLIRSGARTVDAEDGLGLPPCAYFYVGRCDPDYSSQVVTYQAASPCPASVSPFDTGGLFHGLLATVPPTLSLDSKRQMLSDYSFDADSYLDPFRAWVASSFVSVCGYVEGECPAASFVPQITCQRGDDPRNWTWEARLPKAACPAEHLAPQAVLLSEEDAADYMTWLFDSPDLSVGDTAEASVALSLLRCWGEHEARFDFINHWIEAEMVTL